MPLTVCPLFLLVLQVCLAQEQKAFDLQLLTPTNLLTFEIVPFVISPFSFSLLPSHKQLKWSVSSKGSFLLKGVFASPLSPKVVGERKHELYPATVMSTYKNKTGYTYHLT